MDELDRKMSELASMKALLEEIVSHCPGDDTADCPILIKLSGSTAAAAALSSERRQRPTPARAHGRRVPAPREPASYAGLLAWSQTLNSGLAAHHA